MKLFITKKVSTKNNKQYCALIMEKGNREHFLTFDNNLMCKVADISPNALYDLKVGERIEITE